MLAFPTYQCYVRGEKEKKPLHKLSLPGMTYKGVSLHISPKRGGAARQKYTRELSVTVTGRHDRLLSDEKGQVELQCVRRFMKGWEPTFVVVILQ